MPSDAPVKCRQHQAPDAILNCNFARRALMNYYGGSDDSFRDFDQAARPMLFFEALRRFKGCPARHELADDAVQECLLKVLRTKGAPTAYLPGLCPCVMVWLRRLNRNVGIDLLRRQRRCKTILTCDLLPPTPTAERAILGIEIPDMQEGWRIPWPRVEELREALSRGEIDFDMSYRAGHGDASHRRGRIRRSQIRLLLLEDELTQREIAALCGTSSVTVSREAREFRRELLAWAAENLAG